MDVTALVDVVDVADVDTFDVDVNVDKLVDNVVFKEDFVVDVALVVVDASDVVIDVDKLVDEFVVDVAVVVVVVEDDVDVDVVASLDVVVEVTIVLPLAELLFNNSRFLVSSLSASIMSLISSLLRNNSVSLVSPTGFPVKIPMQ